MEDKAETTAKQEKQWSSQHLNIWMIPKPFGIVLYGEMSQKWNILDVMGPITSGVSISEEEHHGVGMLWSQAIIEGIMNSG